MLLFWRAWGWVAVPLALLPLVSGVVLSRNSTWSEYQAGGLGLLTGGVFIALFALIALPTRARRKNLDTGFWAVQKAHTFLFVPLVVWAPIVVVLGVLMMNFVRETIVSY